MGNSFESAEWCTRVVPYCYDPRLSDFGSLLGVLTGFAFAAIVLLIERRITSQGGIDRTEALSLDETLAHLLAAFFCLLMSSFLYATTGGEEVQHERLLLLNITATLVGVIGVANLFSALHALVRGSTFLRAERVVRHLTVWAVPAILYLFTLVSVADWRMVATRGESSDLGVLLWLVIGVLGWLAIRLEDLAGGRALSSFRAKASSRIPLISIAASCLLAASFAVLSVRRPDASLWPPVAYASVLACLLFLLTLVTLALRPPIRDSS